MKFPPQGSVVVVIEVVVVGSMVVVIVVVSVVDVVVIVRIDVVVEVIVVAPLLKNIVMPENNAKDSRIPKTKFDFLSILQKPQINAKYIPSRIFFCNCWLKP